jgi:hypothetical protein
MKHRDKNPEVAVLQQRLIQLGYPIDSKDLNKSYFGTSTREAVKAFQQSVKLEPTGVVARATEKALEAAAPPSQHKGIRMVRGRVFSSSRQSLPGKPVQLFALSLGRAGEAMRERLLAQGITDANGHYELSYQWDTESEETGEPDLKIKVLSPHSDKVLGDSQVHYNASLVVTIYVVLEAADIDQGTEYNRVVENLARVDSRKTVKASKAPSTRFGNLQEAEGRREITYFGNKSGWDSRLVAMVALADRYSSRTGVRPEFFYALFRTGSPANDTYLFRMEEEAVLESWKAAMDKNIISTDLEADMQKALAQFKSKRASYWVSEDAPRIGISRNDEVLGVVLTDLEKRAYANIFYEKRTNGQTFEEAVKASTTLRPKLDELKRLGQWADLTANNASLIEQLGRNGKQSLREVRKLIKEDFYRPEKWETYIAQLDEHALEAFPGATVEERRQVYAAYMSHQLRISFPTTLLARRIETGELPYEPSMASMLSGFMYSVKDERNLATQSLRTFVAGQTISEPLSKELKRLQRIVRLSPNDDVLGTMMDKGLDSARNISKYSEKRFLKEFEGKLGVENARKLYRRAKNVHNSVLNVATTYLMQNAAPGLFPHTENGNGRQNGQPKRRGTATNGDGASFELETLFGSMDFPACEHNASILSPAAYLVELLEMLKDPDSDRDHETNPDAQDILLNRRPDLEYLELSGENTDTVLPYVDLVNEILEYHVMNENLNDFTGFNMHGEVDTEDLLANPQHVKEEAYQKLQEQIYPFSLPFDRKLAELRLYFDAMDVSLLNVLKKIASENTTAIVQETLGLSPGEYDILTSMGGHEIPEYFGVNDMSTLRDLTTKAFTQKVDISYDDLVDLLKCRFINPGCRWIPELETYRLSLRTIYQFLKEEINEATFKARLENVLPDDVSIDAKIAWLTDHRDAILKSFKGLIILYSSADSAKFDQLKLRYVNGDTLHELAYVKIYRFIRLWKKLGWDSQHLDKAMLSFFFRPADDVENPYEGLLTHLVWIKNTMEVLGLRKKDLLKALALWTPIDTYGHDSLYRELFVNPSVKELGSIFEEHPDGKLPAGARIGDHVEAILAALNLTAEELELIVGGNDLSTIKLRLVHLSILYRYALLARSLNISIRELIFLKNLTGINPVAGPTNTMPAILNFTRLAERIKEAGLKPSQLAYLLRHEDWGGEAAPAEEDIRSLAKTIRDELNRIETENEVKDDPEGKLLREKMALLFDESAIAVFFKVINPPLGEEETLAGEAEILFEKYPELEDLYSEWDPVKQDYTALFEYLMRDDGLGLKQSLKQTQLQQTLSSKTGLAPELLDILLMTSGLLKWKKAAMHDFLELEKRGSVENFKQGYFYFEVPKNGEYTFSVETTGTAETLTLEGEDIVGPLSLEVGKLYELAVETTGGGEKSTLKWQALGVPKEAVPSEYLYPKAKVEAYRRTYLRLLKAAAIAEALQLEPKALLYFCMEDDDRWLQDIPVAPVAPVTDSTALFESLEILIKYVLARKTFETDDASLVGILKDPTAITEADDSLLVQVTGWNESVIEELVEIFNGKTPKERLLAFLPIMVKNNLASQLGISLGTLESCATNQPSKETLGQIKGAFRAKYDLAGWRKKITPINDELRNRSRDALVAYILHEMQQKGAVDITTADKLFEHLLIDVSMDACMKTSRLKQAISSTQLFITRCLMNLEPGVVPDFIDSNQWGWMKRYRVWEANRKVFLFPENWLEPELRDDKSPIFREFESELLESDITADSAVMAFYHYLEKLDEVARLDVVSVYYEEPDDNPESDEPVLHVIGKTPGSMNKFFYRRKELGVWTPWEPIGMEIDGEPLLPVVWNGRLFLFWLNVMVEGEIKAKEVEVKDVVAEIECIVNYMRTIESSGLHETPFGEKIINNQKEQLGKLEKKRFKTVERNYAKFSVALSWSEYHKGKWQAVHNSDLSNPIFLKEFKTDNDKLKPEDFRKKLHLSSHVGTQGALNILVDYNAKKLSRFKLYTKHGLPVQSSVKLVDKREVKESFRHRVFGKTRSGGFNIKYFKGKWHHPFFGRLQYLFESKVPSESKASRESELLRESLSYLEIFKKNIWQMAETGLLKQAPHSWATFPRHDTNSPFDAPFFFHDQRHVFLVWPKFLMVPVKPGLIVFPGHLALLAKDPIEIWSRPELSLPDPVDVQFKDALLGELTGGPNFRQIFKDETVMIGQGPSNVLASDQLFVFDNYVIGVQDSLEQSIFEDNAEIIMGNTPFDDAR